MEEITPPPFGPLAAVLALLLRLWGIPGLETPVSLYFAKPSVVDVPASPPRVTGQHTVAVLADRRNSKGIQEQCDVELNLPGAELDHRLLCDLPLAGIPHHRLRVVEPGRGHIFLPGACPKELALPAVTFPRLLNADPADIRTPQAIRDRCGPSAGVLRRP